MPSCSTSDENSLLVSKSLGIFPERLTDFIISWLYVGRKFLWPVLQGSHTEFPFEALLGTALSSSWVDWEWSITFTGLSRQCWGLEWEKNKNKQTHICFQACSSPFSVTSLALSFKILISIKLFIPKASWDDLSTW